VKERPILFSAPLRVPDVKERPILFSAPMVRALLAGTKMQTRRFVTPQPTILPEGMRPHKPVLTCDDEGIEWWAYSDRPGGWNARSPFGGPKTKFGPVSRLWVRENGWERPERSPRDMREGADTWPPYEYDAVPVSTLSTEDMKAWKWKRRPSIHMPRWASRITLEVVAVRVERLQDISEDDAKAEGVEFDGAWWLGGIHPVKGNLQCWPTAVRAYRALWEQINGPGSWDANPWVWVVEFKRLPQ